MLRTFAHGIAGLARQARLLRRHLRYGAASFGAAPSDQKARELAGLFRAVNAHLGALQVEHTLAFGTLLGWHRSGTLLPHDRDVDFAAPVDAFPVIWQSRHRLPPGFTMHDTSHRHGGPKLYVTCRGWEADIYFLAEDHGRLRIILQSRDPGDTAPFPRDYLYPLQPATLLEAPTFVPAQPVALLKHHYGYIGPDAIRDPVTRYYRPRSEREQPLS